ncbi:MAG: FprA family A-type flavoprotein [Bacteroidaceae bacterium]|nr:FprA family A-type flavoprotein [Bacteroidaceae bacterium]
MMNISNTIRYIGVDDLDIDLFESQYKVPEGMSYNSYVILDEKVAVLDTADQRKKIEWQKRLLDTLDGREVDYLVVHHMEPDHAACIAGMAAAYPEMKIVLSAAAAKMLPNFFPDTDLATRTLIVKEGDTLALGIHTLQFIAAPMVHWPEVLMSYEQTEKVLFAADGFGKFGALEHEQRNTDGTLADWACEARRYYFNIVGKYGIQVQNVLKKAAGLDIRTIAPLHGPVLTGKDLSEAVRLYDIWSHYDVETEGVFVAYASIHGGTKAVAEQMVEMLKEKGAKKVAVADLTRDDQAEAVEDAFRYGRLVLLAASYDAGVFPPMHDFLYHLQIKNFQRRRFALVENGSWAPSAGKIMKEMIAQMKDCEVVEPMVTIRSRMKAADLPQLEALAEAILN